MYVHRSGADEGSAQVSRDYRPVKGRNPRFVRSEGFGREAPPFALQPVTFRFTTPSIALPL